jgi:sporulation protein YlmC with PRC-barrel domain
MIKQLIPAIALGLMAATAAQAQTPTPKVVTSTVRLEDGIRASKIIGAPVYNTQNERIGDVSDLYLGKQSQIAMSVIQVGGFLGIGGKLVAVPMDQLQLDQPDKVIMPNGTKDILQAAPSAEYSN